MKKMNVIIAVLSLLIVAVCARGQSQTGADYFVGKWSVVVKGTPNGDAKMIVTLEKKDTLIAGAILDSTGKEISKFSKVELKDTTVTVYFNAQGYDVYLVMNKKNDDHVTGSMMDMLDAEGERLKNATK